MEFRFLLFTLSAILCFSSIQAQETDLERAQRQANWLAEELLQEANQMLPPSLFRCNQKYIGEFYGGKAYLRMELLRRESIKLQGDAPNLQTIVVTSKIPLKTKDGKLTWIKRILVDYIFGEYEDDWKEHKDFYSEFDILVESIIVMSNEGMFRSNSKGSYQWIQKPYIEIDLGVGTIRIGLDEIAGQEIQKAIDSYLEELDLAIEIFLNQ